MRAHSTPDRALLVAVVALSLGSGLGCGGAAPEPVTATASSTPPSVEGQPSEDPQATSASADTPEAAPAEAPAAAAAGPASPVTSAPGQAARPLPEGATVLIIGDSFADSLGLGLKRKQDELGVRFVMQGEKATFIPEWASSKDVPGLVRFWKPDLVIISLGGNELHLKEPQIRASRIKKLVERVGDRPCVWVAPSLWGNEEYGLLKVIEEHSKPCRYYDSNALAGELPRGGDGIHPDLVGQDRWAKALLEWLQAERDPQNEGFRWRSQ